MRMIQGCATVLSLVFICFIPSAHCARTAPQGSAGTSQSLVSIENSIPATLAEYLLGNSIDITGLTPLIPQTETPALCTLESPDHNVIVLISPDGTGIICLQNANGLPAGNGEIITFDTATQDYTIQQLSPECTEQIATAFRSFLSVIVDCVIFADELYCALSIIEFITDFYLMQLLCNSPDEEIAF